MRVSVDRRYSFYRMEMSVSIQKSCAEIPNGSETERKIKIRGKWDLFKTVKEEKK